MWGRGLLIASLVGIALAPRAIAAEKTLDLRLDHPDGASIVLKAVDVRPYSITVAAEIANNGDREVRLNSAHSLTLEDEAHDRYRLNPPADNAELRIPAHRRFTASLVFVGPLNPAARQLTLSTNEGIGTRDNPFDETPILRAVVPVPGADRRAGRQAYHPDGAALEVRDIAAYPEGLAVALVATNGSDREIRLNQDDSLVVTDAQGRATPLREPADNRALAVPPGDRLDATLIFPASRAATGGPVTLSINDGTGGTVDNPYDTLPVFKLTLPIDRHSDDAALPAQQIALAPIARSRLAPSALAARGNAGAPPGPTENSPPPSPPGTSSRGAASGVAAVPPAAPPPAKVATIAPAASSAAPRPEVRLAAMSLPQLKAALHAEDTEDGLRIKLPADTLFGAAPDPTGDALGGDGTAMLQEVARLIALTHPHVIVVAGHTDGIGSDDDNLKLSEQRAHAVAAWIEAHGGKKLPHLVEKGYGRTRPIAPNHNPDGSDNPTGREQNRRIEVLLRG